MKRINRSKSYRVNLSDEERAALERLAWVDGITLADELRKLVRDAARRLGFWTDDDTDDKGQVSEAFAAFLLLFVGFIAFGGLAFVASVAYIQPVMRALGIH